MGAQFLKTFPQVLPTLAKMEEVRSVDRPFYDEKHAPT